MIAIGEGFKAGYRNMLYSMGTDLVILWPGRTTKQAGGQRAGRDVRFAYEDIRAIQQECYLVRHVTAELAGSFQMRSRFNSGVFSTHGITPIYQQIRSMNLADGRLISEADMQEERAVCVIGERGQAAALCGARGGRRPDLHWQRAVYRHRRAVQEGPEQLLQRSGRRTRC